MVLPGNLILKLGSQFNTACHAQDRHVKRNKTKSVSDASGRFKRALNSPLCTIMTAAATENGSAELELWHHFAFKSEGTRSQFNANCATHCQSYFYYVIFHSFLFSQIRIKFPVSSVKGVFTLSVVSLFLQHCTEQMTHLKVFTSTFGLEVIQK